MTRKRSAARRADEAASTTRDALLRAAEAELLTYGLKKTSMEGIAGRAQVAKATLYAYFADKDAVFDAVCAELTDRLSADARAAAAKKKSPREAARASLVEKFALVWRLAHRSPHAQELLGAAMHTGRPLTDGAHARYVDDLARILEGLAPKMTAAKRRDLAEALDRAAEGITIKAASEDELARHLDLVLGLFVER